MTMLTELIRQGVIDAIIFIYLDGFDIMHLTSICREFARVFKWKRNQLMLQIAGSLATASCVDVRTTVNNPNITFTTEIRVTLIGRDTISMDIGCCPMNIIHPDKLGNIPIAKIPGKFRPRGRMVSHVNIVSDDTRLINWKASTKIIWNPNGDVILSVEDPRTFRGYAWLDNVAGPQYKLKFVPKVVYRAARESIREWFRENPKVIWSENWFFRAGMPGPDTDSDEE